MNKATEAKSEPRAVAVARAHSEALFRGDSGKMRSLTAEDVRYAVLSTTPGMPGFDNTGIENLIRDATTGPPDAFVPGSLRIVQSIGDDQRAPLVVAVGSTFGASGPTRLVAARHYQVDGRGMVKTELVMVVPLSPQSKSESMALVVARSHVEAFSHRDYGKAENLLAKDVKFKIITTTPNTEPFGGVGTEEFMKGIRAFGDAIIPGTGKIIEGWGDDTRALLLFSYEAQWGPGGARNTLVRAAHYLLDDDGKIKIEQVIFFPLAS